jgi:peptidoglycan/xylan/chitin deacetylase (PgdA/CDA1 family)
MRDDGHLLGNHTWSHQTMSKLTSSVMEDEIVRCRDLLAKILGEPSPWFRPSGTVVPSSKILEAAGRAGYRQSIGYDVDSKDNTDPGKVAVRTNVLDAVSGGSIVSMHFGHPATIAVLPAVVKAIRDKGLRTVTVAELLA